jgi:hypothetical protein
LVKDMQCGHQLQQIGVAIAVFKEDHDDRWPDCLTNYAPRQPPLVGVPANPTSLITRKDGLLADMGKIFICPRDPSKGTDFEMGRPPEWNASPDFTKLHQSNCSYLYEMNGMPMKANGFDSTLNYFMAGVIASASPPPVIDEKTWAQAKMIAQRTRNFNPATGRLGAPFPADRFPVIRCFYHYTKWGTATAYDAEPAKVKAVSLNLNVFECMPWWEIEIDANNR